MKSALFYVTDPAILPAFEKLAHDRQIRFKVCNEFQVAKEWLSMREYSLLLLPADMKRHEQQELTELLWQRSAGARCVLYDGSESLSSGLDLAKLQGVTLMQGGTIDQELGLLFDELKEAKDTAREDFQIMVVEDLDSPRDIICVFVESLGYPTVVGMRSASDALKELENNPGKFSCVITDIQMPKINGVEFIEIVRHHDKLQHLPVIVLTAYGTVDILVESLRAGASGFLAKPPKKSDLLRELSRATRIAEGKESPRLASHNEAEQIRRIIEEEGLI